MNYIPACRSKFNITAVLVEVSFLDTSEKYIRNYFLKLFLRLPMDSNCYFSQIRSSPPPYQVGIYQLILVPLKNPQWDLNRYTDIHLNRYTKIYRNIQLFIYTDLQVYRFTDVHIKTYSDIQMRRYTDVQVYGFTAMQ